MIPGQHFAPTAPGVYTASPPHAGMPLSASPPPQSPNMYDPLSPPISGSDTSADGLAYHSRNSSTTGSPSSSRANSLVHRHPLRYNPTPSPTSSSAGRRSRGHSISDDDGPLPMGGVNMAESLANTRKEATRRQRIEAEQRRRDELRDGYARLKDVLPVSNQKSSKVSLLERGTPSPLCQSCPSSHLCSYKPHRQLGEDQSPTAGAISVAGSRSLQASCSEREDFAGSYQYAVARSRQHGQPPFVSSSGRFPVLRWPASTRNCRATCCRVKPICFRERLLNRSACDSISSCFISDIALSPPPLSHYHRPISYRHFSLFLASRCPYLPSRLPRSACRLMSSPGRATPVTEGGLLRRGFSNEVQDSEVGPEGAEDCLQRLVRSP